MKRTEHPTSPRKAPRKPQQRRPSHAQLTVMRPSLGEVKVAQLAIAGANLTNPGFTQSILGGMTQGPGMRNQFIGRRIEPIGIYYCYAVRLVAGNYTTNADYNRVVRTTIIQYEDSTTIGTPLARTAVFEDATNVHSAFELINWENIDVLHDKATPLMLRTAISGTNQTGDTVVYKGYIKGKRLNPIVYNDITPGWVKGDIIFCGGSGSSNAPQPQVDGYIRLFFRDI